MTQQAARTTVRRVAMLVFGDVSFDSRVQREANSLVQAGHEVTIFCVEASPETMRMTDARVNVRAVAVPGRRGKPRGTSPFLGSSGLARYAARAQWLARYVRDLASWARAVKPLAAGYDTWHAHDFTGIVAASIARPQGRALVYDVHDLFLETGTGARLPRPLRWAVRRVERRLVRRADLVVTVNEGLADRYRGIATGGRLVVVHNCAPRWTVPEPRPDLLRTALGIAPDEPVLLYHGIIDRVRGLDMLLEAIAEPGLERVHLVLLGAGHDRERLALHAAEPRFGGRAHLLEPVPPADLLPWVASADVGVMPLPPATLNLYLSTPNKLFECLAAGVPVVVSDFPEVSRIAIDDPDGPLGRACDPTCPSSVARALHEILDLDSEAAADLRRRCSKAARERWNWEAQAAQLIEGYRRLTPPSTARRRR
jgi:glycosyltransferase involved in cell wall biosynthesis